MTALGALVRRHPDRAARIVLVILPLLWFAPALRPAHTLAPLDNLFTTAPWSAIAPGPVQPAPALGDVTQVFHPWTLWTAREVRAGRMPFWNPYSYAGAPFCSNPQTACVFPLTWLTWVLPPTLALTVPAILKVIVAGLGMYWFLRGLALSPIAAFVGATAFMFSTTLIAWLPWTFASTIALLPLLFGLVGRLRAQGDRRLVAALALVVALDGVAGYPQAALQALALTAAWTLARVPWEAGAVPFLARVGLGAGVGAALTAVQALPAADYIRESTVYAFRSTWTPPLAVPPRALITVLMPYFFGSEARTWSMWQFNITSTYAGLVPVLILPLAVLAWRRPPTLFFGGVAVVVGLIHYGALAAIAPAPAIAFGSNLRLMPILIFALATLGALGVDVVARGEAGRRALVWLRAWFVVLAATGLIAVMLAPRDAALEVQPPLAAQYVGALTGLALAGWVLRRWIADRRAAWGVALVVVQLATLAPLATYLPVRDTRWLYPTPPSIAWLQGHVGSARVLIADQVGMLYGLRQAHGYDGLSPRRITELAGPIGSGRAQAAGYYPNTLVLHGSEPLPPIAVLLAPTRELFGVRFIVMPPGAPVPDARLHAIYEGSDARIIEDPDALPRAFIAPHARCVGDGEAVTRLRARSVTPTDEVLLAECTSAAVAESHAPTAAEARIVVAPEARILIDEPARVVVAASTAAPAWLVLTDTWFPGWRARLDGADVPVLRANHAFRAVALPPGRHEIEFAFTPRGLRLGAAITIAALVLVGVLLLPRRRVALVIATTAVALMPTAGHASLPAPPFALATSPSSVVAGDAVTVDVMPRGGDGGQWDAYVVWLYAERAAFLGPDGTWMPRPVAFHARLTGGEVVRAVWAHTGPPGDATLALVLVRPGADPLDRAEWTHRPALATLHIAAPNVTQSPLSWPMLTGLFAAAVAATALVWGRALSRPLSL